VRAIFELDPNTVLMQRRSSLDSLMSQSHAVLDGMAVIGQQFQQQTESAIAELRSSKRKLWPLEWSTY
jgi:hypothetical protein